jgi:hypothetical protein
LIKHVVVALDFGESSLRHQLHQTRCCDCVVPGHQYSRFTCT